MDALKQVNVDGRNRFEAVRPNQAKRDSMTVKDIVSETQQNISCKSTSISLDGSIQCSGRGENGQNPTPK